MIQNIAQIISQNPQLIRWIAIILISVGILTTALAAYALHKSFQRKPTPSKLPWYKSFETPPYLGNLNYYLLRKKTIEVNSMSKVFLQLLRLFKNFYGRNGIYYLPLNIVLGDRDSGVTTLQESIKLPTPFTYNGAQIESKELACKIFQKGFSLFVGSEIFEKAASPKTFGEKNTSWHNLLLLLNRYRPKLPANNVTIVVDLKKIYQGQTNPPKSEDIIELATKYAQAIKSLQENCKLKLPVYVVFTKTDIIPGFTDLARSFSKDEVNDILGWSSPYRIDEEFEDSMVDDAFKNIQHLLFKQVSAVLTEKPETPQNQDLYLFPEEISSLHEPLKLFLGRIFKSHDISEPSVFRGIYFVGDGEDAEKLDLDEKHHNKNPDQRNLAFVNSLFEKKIYHESKAVRALSGKTYQLNKAISFVRYGTAGFTILGLYGLISVYSSFSEKKHRIIPVLNRMGTMLEDIQQMRLNQQSSSDIFDGYAKQLLAIMQEIHQTQFFSVWLPASWFSPLHHDLRTSLKIAYQEVVIHTIYVDLLLKARALLGMQVTVDDRSNSIGAMLMPLSTPEFKLLQKYVNNLMALNNMLYIFNNLRSSSSAEDLDKLIYYTFETHLSKEFLGTFSEFQQLINDSYYPLIDLKPYQKHAQKTLTNLYENFLNALTTKQDSLTLPSRLERLAKQLKQSDAGDLPDTAEIHQDIGSLDKVKDNFKEPGKTWMDTDLFNPGKEYQNLLQNIDSLELFGSDLTQYLVDITAIKFAKFKVFVKEFNLNLNPTTDQKKLPISSGIINLIKYLDELFQESFMITPGEDQYLDQIPETKTLYWNKSLVQQSQQYMHDYDQFVTKSLPHYLFTIQDSLKLAARKNTQELVLSTLAKAQSFTESQQNFMTNSALEENIRSEIQDFKAMVEVFKKLLIRLNENDMGPAFVSLRDVLCQQAQSLLMLVSQWFDRENPYQLRQDSFSWWDGKTNPALGAFLLRNNVEVDVYLGVQRQILMSASLEFAQPLVELLSLDTMKTSPKYNPELVAQWLGLVKTAEAYKKKQPGNDISVLEDFIKKDLGNMTVDKALDEITLDYATTPIKNYLLDTKRYIEQRLLERAEILKRQESIVHYQQLQQYFNRYLASKFPFFTGSVDNVQGEADPEDMREFYQAYKKFGNSPEKVLNQLYQLGDDMADVVKFVQQMEDIKTFFKPFFDDNSLSKPQLKGKIDFRTLRHKEKGANMVVDWYLKTDNSTKVDRADGDHTFTWNYGEPVVFGFSWPEADNPLIPKPLNENTQPNLFAEENTAEYVFDSKWSLLWLVFQQKAPVGSFSKLSEPNPYVLKFVVPLNSQSYAILFNNIHFTQPQTGKDDKEVNMPTFPTAAPNLPESILKYENEVVFANGIRKPKTFISFGHKTVETDDADDQNNTAPKPSASNGN